MKILFASAFFFITSATFAQDAKKDTTANEYGMRIFDARLGRYISKDSIKHTPYSFADTKIQPADKPKNTTTTK